MDIQKKRNKQGKQFFEYYFINRNYHSIPDEFLEKNFFYENEVVKYTKNLEKKINNLSSKIEPNWAIPILIYATEKIYYDVSRKKDFKEYGPAIKQSIPLIWTNNFKPHGEQKNYKLLGDIISLNILLFKVRNAQALILNDNDKEAKVGFSVDKDGNVIYSESTYEYMHNNYMLPSVSKYGKDQRSNKSSTKLMKNLLAYYNNVYNVLQGIEPRTIDFFKGTVLYYFKGISDQNYKNFWQELYARLTVLILLTSYSSTDNDKPIIYIFPALYILNKEKTLFNQETFNNLIWTNSHMNNEKMFDHNAIVNRPILRIENSSETYYATSFGLLIDNINHFIEASVFKIQSIPNIKNLKDEKNSPFVTQFSEKFEEDTIHLFLKYTKMAGNVNNKGIWNYSNEYVNLKQYNTDNFPGEIDCLAEFSNSKEIYLVECKVMNDAYTEKNYKSTLQQIQKFRMKLSKKENWIKSVFKEYQVYPILLLDKSIFIKKENSKDNIMLMSYDDLEEKLKEIY